MDWVAFRAGLAAELAWFAALGLARAAGAAGAEWADFLWAAAPAPGSLVYAVVWFKNRYGG